MQINLSPRLILAITGLAIIMVACTAANAPGREPVTAITPEAVKSVGSDSEQIATPSDPTAAVPRATPTVAVEDTALPLPLLPDEPPPDVGAGREGPSTGRPVGGGQG